MNPAATPAAPSEPRPVLGLRAIVMLTMGVVIGAGIFKAPSMVAGMAGSTAWMFGAWILGGVISLIGALCYAELATSHPSAGGDYHFLRLAYGRGLAFLFAWARFAVITTGSIALLAFVFGDYMQQVLPLGASGSFVYAVAVVLLLWWVNARGIRAGTSAQVVLTSLEILGLLAIVLAGAWLASSGAAPATVATRGTPGAGAFGLAMVFVLLTYGGWNEAAYISAELKDNRRNMVLGLVTAIALITALYLLVTWAYWRGLGLQGLAKSEAPAADLLAAAFGAGASRLISLAVAIAALTSINATMIVGARSNYAAGRDWPALRPIGLWDGARSTPRNAMHLQNGAALVLLAIGAWTGGGFRAMVEFTAPVFWLFFLLTGVALFLLRRRAPAASGPYRIPLYPVLPALFCATCAYMLWSSLSYVYSQSLGGFNAAWIGVAVLAAGALVLALLNARSAAGTLRPSSEETRA